MPNIIDYVKWRGDISFETSPFNEIDGLIFAELSYIPFDKIIENNQRGESLCDLAKKFFSLPDQDTRLGAIIPEVDIKELFNLTSKSVRFSSVKLKNYVNCFSRIEEKQFCGMTFVVDKNNICIAFRGTDDTLVGWKEDFNMALNIPIPSQTEAVNYVNSVGFRTRVHIYLCGHSKGGNLATYAGIFANERVKKRIVNIFDFDGPGFRTDFLKGLSLSDVSLKIRKAVPQATIIGAIYDSVVEPIYVKSSAKGLYQHDAFKWEILGNSFVCVEALDKSSKDFHDLLNSWTLSMSSEERTEFVEALFRLVTVNESATLSDIASDKFKFLLGILKSDGHTKKVFLSAINRLIKEKYFKKDNKNAEISDKIK